MTFTELLTEVYAITNRPDLVDRTKSAIRSATLTAHQSDYFYKDLFETGIVFPTSSFIQQFDYITLIPQWRSLKYIRATDADGADYMKFFDVIQPEAVLDDYGLNRTDVCYAAGTVIQIRSSTEFQYALLGCYLNPVITEIGYNSWIARDTPWAIIYLAAANIFKSIGKQEEWAAANSDANIQMQLLKQSNVMAGGW